MTDYYEPTAEAEDFGMDPAVAAEWECAVHLQTCSAGCFCTICENHAKEQIRNRERK